MPRRNRRKHYRNEGELGFDPNKYIGAGRNMGQLQAVIYAVRVPKDSRPASYRRKARSMSKKRRRAMEEVQHLQTATENLSIPEREMNNYSFSDLAQPRPHMLSTPSTPITLSKQVADRNKTTILKGVRRWIKTIFHV